MATLDKPNEYKVIGTSPLPHDAVDKVTGRAAYGADIRLPGMLYGAVLRSPHAHARHFLTANGLERRGSRGLAL